MIFFKDFKDHKDSKDFKDLKKKFCFYLFFSQKLMNFVNELHFSHKYDYCSWKKHLHYFII